MSARLDRQEEQLTAMSAKLQHLAATLDRRLSCVLISSDLRAQLAAMEHRLADRLDAAKEANGSSERRQVNTAPSCGPPSEIASSRSQGSAEGSSPEKPHGAPTRPGPQPAGTYTLKHSFLRRFARSDEERAAAAGRSPSGSHQNRLMGMKDRVLESVFGICEPDPKVGKEGSRVIHPQSHFVTGDPAGPALPPAGASESSPRAARRDAEHELPPAGLLGVHGPDAAFHLEQR